MLAIKISNRMLAGLRYAFTTGHVNRENIKEAVEEYQKNPSPKFHNKKYYNPDYHYHMEGPDIIRLYSERDNSHHQPDFTDVLDSVYSNVCTRLSLDDYARVLLSSLLLCRPLLL